MHEVLERGLSAVLDGAIALLGSGPVYLTVDVDVLDPAFAPGTGTPEPGGMTSRELLSACRRVATDLALIGADVVEVSPMAFGTADITALVGARIAHEVLTGCALRRAASATAGPAGFVKPTPG